MFGEFNSIGIAFPLLKINFKGRKEILVWGDEGNERDYFEPEAILLLSFSSHTYGTLVRFILYLA
jgi:hypothetical protein